MQPCPECGYADNRDGALTCNLCGRILRRERSPRPEAEAPPPRRAREDKERIPYVTELTPHPPVPPPPKPRAIPEGVLPAVVFGPLIALGILWAAHGMYVDFAEAERTNGPVQGNAVMVLLYMIGGKWLPTSLLAIVGLAFALVGVAGAFELVRFYLRVGPYRAGALERSIEDAPDDAE
ncbi:MAG: hypothetical protein HYV09_23795 [Deltaproteobacteria bacterium]|nr:hypothetical protein [Deltaproteobacteria bacterium]